jgi:carbohydrate kinase (thermoresistant glucokinase family)
MIIVLMGVSGAGKTTIGTRLAARLGARFLEGDRFHPEANVAKMSRGLALDDADRIPWLERLAGELRACRENGASAVLACSALRRAYREILADGRRDVKLVYLRGEMLLIRDRLRCRTTHFMPASLLDSQFAALEEPGAEEGAVTVDISGDPEAIVAAIVAALGTRRREDEEGRT